MVLSLKKTANSSTDGYEENKSTDVGLSQDQEEPAQEKKQEEKIEEAIKQLPPDVQGEIERMVRRDPRIANSLANSQGQVDGITNAVRTGRQAAADPDSKPSNIQGVDPALHPVAEGAYHNAKQENVEHNVSGGESVNEAGAPLDTPGNQNTILHQR